LFYSVYGSCKTRDFHIWVLWVKAFEDTNLKINRSLWSSHYFYYFLFEQYFEKITRKAFPLVVERKRKTFEAASNEPIRPLFLQVAPIFPADARHHERRSTSEYCVECGGKRRECPRTHPLLGIDRPAMYGFYKNALRNPIRHAWLILVRRDFCCCCNTSIQWFRCKW